MTKQEKKQMLKVTNVASRRGTKKAKSLEEKEAQRLEILSRDSGTLSKASAVVQERVSKEKPVKGRNHEDMYLETLMLTGEPFSVGELAREMDMAFQSVRAKVLRIAKRLDKKIVIESRGKWTVK